MSNVTDEVIPRETAVVGQPEAAQLVSTGDKPLLTLKEFYAELKGTYGLNNLYNAARSGRLKTVKVGRKFLVPRAEVTDFLMREAA